MRSQFAKIALAAALTFAALVPAACGAIAVPGQDPLAEYADSARPNGAHGSNTTFDLPGEGGASGKGWQLSPLNAVIKRGLQIVAGVSVLMIVWAGYLYLTSYGEEEKVKKAKKAVLWTILGLVTGLGGWAVIDLVNSISLNAK